MIGRSRYMIGGIRYTIGSRDMIACRDDIGSRCKIGFSMIDWKKWIRFSNTIDTLLPWPVVGHFGFEHIFLMNKLLAVHELFIKGNNKEKKRHAQNGPF